MSPVGKLSCENLSSENSRARWADAAQLDEHVALAFDGRVLRIRRVSFGFRHTQLCFNKIETSIFPLEFGAQTIGKQRPFSGAQGGKVDPGAPQPWFDAANALSKQQSLDAVDMGGALPHQPLAFTMRTACVFLDGPATWPLPLLALSANSLRCNGASVAEGRPSVAQRPSSQPPMTRSRVRRFEPADTNLHRVRSVPVP